MNIGIRIFTVDERTGGAVPGVVVTLSAAGAPRDGMPLARVVSDGQGFAKAHLESEALANMAQLSIASAAAAHPLIVSVEDLLNGNDVVRMAVNAASVGAEAPASGIVSVNDPDARDALLSPGSIGLIPQLNANRGLCGQLMPTTIGVRRF